MIEASDWQLVAQARAGDSSAFAELIRRYEMPVMRFCLRMVGSREDAEELAQDSFVRVHRHLSRLKPHAKFSTVLFGIARNLTLNFIRDAGRRGRGRGQAIETETAIPDEALRPDRSARLREIEVTLEQGIAMLSPKHREVIVLRELQGLDYTTIARICRCRKGTVRSRLARAREQLRTHMIALGGDLL